MSQNLKDHQKFVRKRIAIRPRRRCASIILLATWECKTTFPSCHINSPHSLVSPKRPTFPSFSYIVSPPPHLSSWPPGSSLTKSSRPTTTRRASTFFFTKRVRLAHPLPNRISQVSHFPILQFTTSPSSLTRYTMILVHDSNTCSSFSTPLDDSTQEETK